jgi:cob(I)alamin adenosyltransferase
VTLYTRTGDAGDTGLLDGSRVPKSDARIEACGSVDELNATLGMVRAAAPGADLDEMIAAVQRDLLALGARLADPASRVASRAAKTALSAEDVTRLEAWIDTLEAGTPPLRRFIVPAGPPPAVALHWARTVCRRAERRIVALGSGAVDAVILAYLNRLSDLLFAMARAVGHRAGVPDEEW